MASLNLWTICAYSHEKSAISHIRRMGIMIIFAAENDLTQMILCLTQTAQTYTEWAALLLPAAVGYAECSLGLTQTTQNSQNGCIASPAAVGVSTERLRNKKIRLYVRNIFCATN